MFFKVAFHIRHKRQRFVFADQSVIAGDRTDFVERALHDRRDRGFQIVSGDPAKVLCRGVFGTVVDRLGIVDGHPFDGLPKQLFGFRRGFFGGAVDFQLNIVGQAGKPGFAEHALCILEAAWQRNMNRRVGVEAVWGAQLCDHPFSPDAECFFETFDNLRLAERCGGGGCAS